MEKSRMLRFIKAFWLLTVPIFFAVLLFIYAYLPEEVVLPFNNEDWIVKKSTFFNMFIIVFTLASLINLVALKVFEKLTSQEANKTSYVSHFIYGFGLKEWSGSFAVVSNIFLILAMIVISAISRSNDNDLFHYSFLAYIGPVLILLWVFMLVALLVKIVSANK